MQPQRFDQISLTKMRNFFKNKKDSVPKQSVKREWKHLKQYELPKRNSTGEELVGLNYRAPILVGVHLVANIHVLYTQCLNVSFSV